LALLGYKALGLSWDERNQSVARQRAKMCKTALANFEGLDVRQLDMSTDPNGQFDVVLCCENIEHVLDNQQLMVDMVRYLKPGSTLRLTTPNFNYRAITVGDEGPFLPIENGGCSKGIHRGV
jgi:2-polyprenyl-3-methyl-5-hydroxy-6-metoxy-1,4-benzoquinol methylase